MKAAKTHSNTLFTTLLYCEEMNVTTKMQAVNINSSTNIKTRCLLQQFCFNFQHKYEQPYL